MSNSPQILKSNFWPDDIPVMKGHPMVNFVKAMRETKFGSRQWTVGYRENTSVANMSIDFDRLFPLSQRHLLARELLMFLLNNDTNTFVGERRLKRYKGDYAVIIVRCLRRLYLFMDSKSIGSLRDLTQSHLNQFVDLKANSSDEVRQRERSHLATIYAAGESMTNDRLSFMPWEGVTGQKYVKRSLETKTKVIPPDVMGPLLIWAMKYVDHYSDDIIGAFYNQRLNSAGHRAIRENIKGIKGVMVKAMLSDRAAVIRDKIERAAVGDYHVVAESGLRWRESIEGLDIADEFRNLVAACYIVTAYLSGMRDSEVQAIRRGGLEIAVDSNSNVIRRYLESTQYKGSRVGGKLRTWVVVEPVERAIMAVLMLSYYNSKLGGKSFMFISPSMFEGDTVPVKSYINNNIASFIDHVNNYLEPRHRSPSHPPIPIERFGRITTRMFRKTIAWHIANQPFGIVAGMIQFGHLKAQMFEGYAGTASAGLLKDIEEQQALANAREVRAIFDDHLKGIKVAGPLSSEINTEMEKIGELASFEGKVVTDGREIDAMLRHRATSFYPRPVNDCFFNRDRAQCLPPVVRGKTDNAVPVTHTCKFDRCENSCWRLKHLPAIQARLEDLLKLATKNNTGPGQRAIVREESARLNRMVEEIKEAASGGH